MIVLIADFPAVIAHLTEESTELGEGGSTAVGLLKVLSTAKLLVLLHFISDLLGVLSHLSKQFNSDDVFIGDLPGTSSRKKVEKRHKSQVVDGYQEKLYIERLRDHTKRDESGSVDGSVSVSRESSNHARSDNSFITSQNGHSTPSIRVLVKIRMHIWRFCVLLTSLISEHSEE